MQIVFLNVKTGKNVLIKLVKPKKINALMIMIATPNKAVKVITALIIIVPLKHALN